MSATMTVPVRRVRIAKRSLGWAVLVLLIVLWQVVTTVAPSPSFPTFLTAVQAFGQLLFGPTLVTDVLPSLGRLLGAFAISGVLGIVLGLVIGSIRALDPWVYPVFAFFRSIPPALIIPIALAAMGLGPQVVIATIVFAAFWPVLLNTIDGVRRMEPLYLDVAQASRVDGVARLVRVTLPAVSPTIMAGLRTALGLSFVMLVVAELLAATDGLGFQMGYAQQTFNVPRTYGAVLLLALLGWALDTLFLLIERRVLRWHPVFRGGDHG